MLSSLQETLERVGKGYIMLTAIRLASKLGSFLCAHHVIRVCLPSQSEPEKHNQEKKAHIPLRTS